MPKTLFEEVVFGIMMVCFMVYGMVVYNIALATGGIDASAFMEALRELSGDRIEPEECRAAIDYAAFRDIFRQYFLWHTASDGVGMLAE